METERTIKTKFWIGDKVKLTYGDVTGIVASVDILPDEQIKYWMLYVSKEGEVIGKWVEDLFLEKIA